MQITFFRQHNIAPVQQQRKANDRVEVVPTPDPIQMSKKRHG